MFWWSPSGSDRALCLLFGLIYTRVQIRASGGDLILFCAGLSSIRYQSCLEDMQCAWSLPLLIPLIQKNLIFLLVGLASTFPVEWACPVIPLAFWEFSVCAGTAFSAWVSQQVNSFLSTAYSSLVAHLGFEPHGVGWFSLITPGPGCPLFASVWVGVCLLLLLC